jgi:putative oxidoreductase
MKRLLSTKYSNGAFNFAMLFLRLTFGVLLFAAGYGKLTNYQEFSSNMMNFLGLGQQVSAALLIFAEVFCTALVVLGLFTRLATIPIIIAMSVALFKAHDAQIFGDGRSSGLFLIGFIVIFLLGPGKISVDGAMGK